MAGPHPVYGQVHSRNDWRMPSMIASTMFFIVASRLTRLMFCLLGLFHFNEAILVDAFLLWTLVLLVIFPDSEE